jgi:hypothetical protein
MLCAHQDPAALTLDQDSGLSQHLELNSVPVLLLPLLLLLLLWWRLSASL